MRRRYKQSSGSILIPSAGTCLVFGAALIVAFGQLVAVQQAGAQQTQGRLAVARVSQVTASPSSNSVDVEITTTRSVAVRSQVLTGPDRLILDFPDALPGRDLRDQSINNGPVKGIRVSLFAHNPLVTRVVIDLKSAQPYRIYPSGTTVTVKLGMDKVLAGEKQAAGGGQGRLNTVSHQPPVPARPAPVLNVQLQDGRMSILAHDVSLAQVLSEVQHKTGADIPIPSAAAQEQVVADIGLLPVRDSLTALLNGSRFNFVMVGADNDPSTLKSLILTFRGGGASPPPVAPVPSQPAVVDTPPEPEPPQPEMQVQPEQQAQPDPQPQPEPQPQPQEGQGQQESPAPQDVPPPQ